MTEDEHRKEIFKELRDWALPHPAQMLKNPPPEVGESFLRAFDALGGYKAMICDLWASESGFDNVKGSDIDFRKNSRGVGTLGGYPLLPKSKKKHKG